MTREQTTLFRRFRHLHQAERRLWRRCCRHDGINPAAVFVVFAPDNPYVKGHERAISALFAFKKRIVLVSDAVPIPPCVGP